MLALSAIIAIQTPVGTLAADLGLRATPTLSLSADCLRLLGGQTDDEMRMECWSGSLKAAGSTALDYASQLETTGWGSRDSLHNMIRLERPRSESECEAIVLAVAPGEDNRSADDDGWGVLILGLAEFACEVPR